eukprot:GHRR01017690.1.p1 GENE.GHRR01017690.1~~GHRR01017690.1.p1  ORF type:complete len:405 (+),score=105.87 GHRR01017690.1:321-1535(+)
MGAPEAMDIDSAPMENPGLNELLAGDPSKLAEPIKLIEDKFKLLPAFLKIRGLVKQHIESFNYFIEHEIKKIVKANERVTCDTDPNFYLKYTGIHIGPPCLEEEYRQEEITPQQCRLRDITYAAPIYVDVEYTRGREIVSRRGPGQAIRIGRMPLMLRCNRCLLANRTEPELFKLGECPLDPGGYFIVRGTEKVILIQEQLSKNRIIIDTDQHGEVVASVTSSTHERKSKTNIAAKNGKIYLKHNAFSDDLNIVAVMKAMGAESDQEVVGLIGPDEQLAALLVPSLQECKSLGVFSQAQALEYLGGKLQQRGMKGFMERRRKSKVDEARDVLANVVLCHVPVVRYNYAQKVLFVAVMIRRVMYAQLDSSFIDDRDYYGNKRLELAGMAGAMACGISVYSNERME